MTYKERRQGWLIQQITGHEQAYALGDLIETDDGDFRVVAIEYQEDLIHHDGNPTLAETISHFDVACLQINTKRFNYLMIEIPYGYHSEIVWTKEEGQRGTTATEARTD